MKPSGHPVPPADGQPPLAWSLRRTGTADVLRLVGDLDLSTAQLLHRVLFEATTWGAGTELVLDFSEVRFLDAHCVGVIEQAWARAKVRGRTLSVRRVHGLPARVFDILGMRSWLCHDGDTAYGNTAYGSSGRGNGQTRGGDGGRDAATRDTGW